MVKRHDINCRRNWRAKHCALCEAFYKVCEAALLAAGDSDILNSGAQPGKMDDFRSSSISFREGNPPLPRVMIGLPY